MTLLKASPITTSTPESLAWPGTSGISFTLTGTSFFKCGNMLKGIKECMLGFQEHLCGLSTLDAQERRVTLSATGKAE